MKVLVISYFFPPFKRVGGRRWAKHLKYFQREKIDFHVLAGTFKESDSPWNSDIESYSSQITRVPSFEPLRPYFKKTLPQNLYQKFRWKFSFVFWTFLYKFKNGDYTDDSIKSTDYFFREAKKIILQKGIKTVILSVGPFNYAKIILMLKDIFPKVKFIIDYRDFLEESLIGLTDRQKKFELLQQAAILSTVDAVLTADVSITEHIALLTKKPIYTLPHAVDEDFLCLNEGSTVVRKPVPTFIYGGLLYDGLDLQLTTFRNFFESFVKKAGVECKADFYVYYPCYENLLNLDGISLKPVVDASLFQQYVLNADYILLLESSLSMASFFTSKFYEILCFRKPILFFGRKGAVSEFLISNHLGFHITEDNLQELSDFIVNNPENLIDKNYPIKNHSFQNVTSGLIEFLHKV